MRILVANDGFGDAGGVQQYLDAVIGGLLSRGHRVALLHRDPVRSHAHVPPAIGALPQFSVADDGLAGALRAAAMWHPDVCYSHNMDILTVDRQLASTAPVVKFMHGYFGTCASGLKRHAWPAACPCDRTFGPACALLFFPRHCGRFSVSALKSGYRWAREQRDVFMSYHTIVVASRHMQDEYVRNGVDATRVHVNPLFPTFEPRSAPTPPPSTPSPTIAFLARMTPLKGGDVLIRAIAEASRRLSASIALTMVGDGPIRGEWEALARRCGVDATFTGWLDGDARLNALATADAVAVPSTWPEPFGLTGLEAAALGIPAIAFDVGGIREWLRPGVNGVLVEANPPTASALAAAIADAFRDRTCLVAMRPHALAVAREMSLDRHLDRLGAVLDRCVAGRQPASAPAGERR